MENSFLHALALSFYTQFMAPSSHLEMSANHVTQPRGKGEKEASDSLRSLSFWNRRLLSAAQVTSPVRFVRNEKQKKDNK